MRRCLLTLVSVAGLVLGGCAHMSAPDADDGWQATSFTDGDVGAARAETDGAKSDWSPIKTSAQTSAKAGAWSDHLIVAAVPDAGPHAVAHEDGPYLLDSGDKLRVFVYGQPNLSRIYKVDHAGNIMMPLLGVVRAQRRTTYQLAGVIRGALGRKYVRDPQVTVDIHENRPFFILGEVRQPGQYPYVNGMTVETAVAGRTPSGWSTH